MFLRDLEQHAPEVVRDERGDGGEQRAKRLDETLGLLAVGELGRLERTAHVLVEHLDRVAGDRSGRLVVATREREEVVEREAGLEEPQAGAQHVDVVDGVTGTPVAQLGNQEPFAHDGLDQRSGDAHPGRELVEVEQLGVALLRAGDRGGERRVGGVELTVEQPADHRERESLALELLDAAEAVFVIGVVPGHTALTAGRWEELALLVEADGVDRDVGAAGELLDSDGAGDRFHE